MDNVDTLLKNKSLDHSPLNAPVDEHHQYAERCLREASGRMSTELKDELVEPLVGYVLDAMLLSRKEIFELRAVTVVNNEPGLDAPRAQAREVVERQGSLAAEAERSVVGYDADAEWFRENRWGLLRGHLLPVSLS